MRRSYYTAKTKISDILQDNMRRVGMLELFGIKSGFDSDLSVMELCHAHNVNLDLFLHVFNIYTFADYLPEENSGSRFPADHAIDYLVKAQDFFVDVCLVQMKEYCDAIRPCPMKGIDNVAGLLKALTDVTNEHFLSCRKIFAQYRNGSKPVSPEQIGDAVEQELKVTQVTDTLIRCLSELKVPEEYKVPVDYLKYYLIFTRADYDKQRKINDATFKELLYGTN